jgi:hypothetical protein
MKVKNADKAAKEDSQGKLERSKKQRGNEKNCQDNPVGDFKFSLERVFDDGVHFLNSL